MIVPILIDTADLSAEFSLTKQDVDSLLEYTVQEITKEYARVWENKAKSTLKSSRSDYIRSIRVDSQGRFTGRAYLDPITWLANAVEMGVSGFDMKRGMLNSPKAKQGKNGKYLTIPFRFATPSAIGDSSVFAGIMPVAVQRAVIKQEKSNPSSPGLKLGDIPQQYQMPKSHSLRMRLRSKGFDKLKSNTQMTSKFEGVRRNSSGGGYVTFRRVSEFSDDAAFQHPGIEERDIAGQALSIYESRIPDIVDISTDNFLVSLGF